MENKYFLQFDNFKEICEELSERLKNEKILLSENDKILKVSIPLHSSKNKEFICELIEKEKNDKEKISEMMNLINIQNKKIEELEHIINENKKEMKNQNDIIINLEERIKILENFFNKNKSENNQQKILFNDLKDFDLNSIIINNNRKYMEALKNWINPYKDIKAELLYRLSRDGKSTATFHEKCDNKGPTLSIFNLEKGNIIGIYTPLNWDTSNEWKNDMDSFLFNLNKNIKFSKKKKLLSIFCNKNYGPFVGCIGVSGETIQELCKIDNFFYKDKYENSNNILSDNEFPYKIYELEIFRIIY